MNNSLGVDVYLVPVVQTLDSAIQRISIREINCVIQWIEIYAVDSAIQRINLYPVDSAVGFPLLIHWIEIFIRWIA